MNHIVGVHHISLLTNNFARLRDFYVEVLGLRIAGGFPGQNIIFLEAGNVLIELEEHDSTPANSHAPPDDRVGLGWNHLAFDVDDVDAAFNDLISLGVRSQAAPADYPEGAATMRIAFLSDPDGNIIELIARL